MRLASLNPSNNELYQPLVETLERIRVTSKVAPRDWCDLLGVRRKDYQDFKTGNFELLDAHIEEVAKHFGLSLDSIKRNRVNFSDLAVSLETPGQLLPEKYIEAAYGRRRSTLNAIDYIEKYVGWRLHATVLEKFELPQSQLRDPFAPISVKLISDLCSYLHRRHFRARDFFLMGASTYQSTRYTLIGEYFASLNSVAEIYDVFLNDAMKLFESNCDYRLTQLSDSKGTFEVRSNPHVAAELGVKHIGNRHVCAFKAGVAASIPCFLNLPLAQVTETSCVHLGDDVCRYEFSFINKRTH